VLMKIKLSSSTSAANGVATVSVASRLDEAIAALGPHDAINKLRGIRSHAQYVLHSVVISSDSCTELTSSAFHSASIEHKPWKRVSPLAMLTIPLRLPALKQYHTTLVETCPISHSASVAST
jgi:hypothetical protein